MISPRHATMFCFVQTDAALDAETLDLLTGVCVKRSFDRISVDGQLSTSDTVVRARERRVGRAGRAASRRTSSPSARRSTRCCASSRSRSSPTARAPGASGAIVVRGGPTPSSRSRARSPTRRSSRPRSTAATPTSAASCRPPARRGRPATPFVVDLEIEGHQVVSAGDAIEPRPARARELVQGDEVEYALTHPRRGRRDRGLLLRPQPGVRQLQRGVHVMRDVATLLEALPYIRDFHGKTVVIKYGGAAMTDPDAARGVRARRRAPQVRRA